MLSSKAFAFRRRSVQVTHVCGRQRLPITLLPTTLTAPSEAGLCGFLAAVEAGPKAQRLDVNDVCRPQRVRHRGLKTSYRYQVLSGRWQGPERHKRPP